jgi:hypothetical protein
LTKRFASSRRFERALFQRIGERRYFIKNKTIWSALLAERDLVIIDFASWVRGICEKGGFFGQLQAHHVQCLRSARSKIFKKSRSPWETCRQKAWGDLFDNVTHDQIKPELIKKPKDTTWESLKPVVTDRDTHRAHRHEHSESKEGNVLALSLTKLAPYLELAQQLLNRLSLVAADSTFGYKAAGEPQAEFTSIIDLLLVGEPQRLAQLTGVNEHLYRRNGFYWWQVRDTFFRNLEAPPSEDAEGDACVNGDQQLRSAGEATKQQLSPQGTTDLPK